jgi:hypothetical protein
VRLISLTRIGGEQDKIRIRDKLKASGVVLERVRHPHSQGKLSLLGKGSIPSNRQLSSALIWVDESIPNQTQLNKEKSFLYHILCLN